MTIIDARRAHRPLSGVLTLCRCAHVIVLAACAVWQIAALTALTAAAHQGGSACPFTLLADLLACPAVARMDSLGAILITPFVGFVLQAIGGYISKFFYGGCGLHSGAGGGAPPGVTTQPARVEQPA
ncbi:hypothetical protein Q6A26_08000 [Xanthomonas euvesicatoria pv. eucalypti]|uniref:hypothetical protein n=1 Tax=Xanthomonas euvesicatoria TaxID=456327 RepID=UPI0026E3F8B6|nr:hypothetical protein [Xanthomonas euvesicatoria]MDO7934516.1 hypothetical protein [Xanthomonas euvesicatoria pv. eucalypti]MDO7938660.1 hypothetical protein [Xanthomonas euvesicatoria pv. eucalypti]MDO7942896.1 hypothetical protein [Xanthomonas euvesicatoria pv. eucalypti]MDO7947108.1 hypothetical protein [Xanthomonas euvesicatoria pv. eucalypti]MDO7950147.1 hypothetical protein [Xanthomonas euvesicatoria pv. eucalypti]